ncbi:MAG: T9SS type A sorting domain-containing protein, partial [Bacteroidetes bacterium]|nr:T9SS type A sorting domain-containing protein [Bacteroidota bacterium]
NASEEIDQLDAKKLNPLKESKKLFSLMSSLESLVNQPFMQLSFPFFVEESSFSINETGSLVGEWSFYIQQKVGTPNERSFYVFDTETNKEMELKVGQEFTFTAKKQESMAKTSAQALVMSTSGTKRFIVKINSGNLTSITNEIEQFKQIELHQNYPNPFNPSTEIAFIIPSFTQVKLSIYTILGEKIAELENGSKAAGFYSVSFDASNLSSGMYLYRLEAGNNVMTKKLLLVK